MAKRFKVIHFHFFPGMNFATLISRMDIMQVPGNSQNLVQFSSNLITLSKDISKELIRKSLHLLIACTPALAALIGTQQTIFLLGTGVLFYTAAEYFRLTGIRVPFISRVTELAMRDRDQDHFVLGPVTLGIGAMLALMLYPEPAATIAIYALAFGDGLSSVAGKLFGTIRIPFTGGKSIEGSLACFLAVMISIVLLVPSIPPRQAIAIAIIATILEVLPSKDFDNLILPVGTGIATVWLT